MRTAKFAAIKNRKTGEIKGWVELFWCRNLRKYVSIPGLSRWVNPDGEVDIP